MGIIFGEDGYPMGKDTKGHQFNVMCIDDSQFIIKQISQILLSRDFNVIATATNGREGVEKFNSLKGKIDLITLDITMPEMDGLEVLKKIHQLDPDVVIIMVTALGTADAVKEAIKFGAKGYIVKPLDRNKVLERIGQILK